LREEEEVGKGKRLREAQQERPVSITEKQTQELTWGKKSYSTVSHPFFLKHNKGK